MPKVFLSFASEDIDFIIKLSGRLKSLGFNVWDYSGRDEGIRGGRLLVDGISEQVIDSDYFIPVASINSTREDKELIQFEIQLADSNNKPCFPLILANRPPQKWYGAFEWVKRSKGIEINPEDDKDFESKICALCNDLDIPYTPDTQDHLRLPLYRRVQSEIDAQYRLDQVDRRFIYEKLKTIIGQFNILYENGHWAKSLERLYTFFIFVKEGIEDPRFYFPLIAKGACQLQLNLLNEAEQTFIEAANCPLADENAYGGLGQVYLKQNKFERALINYNIALSKCPPGLDREILYNIFTTVVEILGADQHEVNEELIFEARRIIGHSGYMERLDSMEGINLKESFRIKLLLGLVCFRNNEYEKANHYLSSVYKREAFNIESAIGDSEFSKSDLSVCLFNVFKNAGFPLSAGLYVLKNNIQDWLIKDGESLYVIKKNSKNFAVYYRESSVSIFFSHLLSVLQKHTQSLALLKDDALATRERILFHYYANQLISRGDLVLAKDVYRNYLCTAPFDNQYMVEYALLLCFFKEKEEMRNICNLAIASGRPVDDKSSNYYKSLYYYGYAFFLLGQKNRAMIYYDESNEYGPIYKPGKCS